MAKKGARSRQEMIREPDRRRWKFDRKLPSNICSRANYLNAMKLDWPRVVQEIGARTPNFVTGVLTRSVRLMHTGNQMEYNLFTC